MPFVDAIWTLHDLKRRRAIRDYVIIGAVAATAYMEPLLTEDLDIVVLADSDEEYVQDFRRVAEIAEGMEGMHLIFGGIPVQMFPSTTKPLYEATLHKARSTRIGGLRAKLARPEHLILLYLEAFREKDHQRIRTLLPQADLRVVSQLLERFDDEDGTLAHRLESIH
jgi:hypothetical protein